MIHNSLEVAICSITTFDPIFHIHSLFNFSFCYKKFQTWYKNTGFLKHNSILFKFKQKLSNILKKILKLEK